MREYSPRRRTALLLVGTGTAGAYHAGVLKALDESGVKVDLVVGSGVGALGAAFSAVAAGPGLYGPGGFWDGISWEGLYRVRPFFRVALLLVGLSCGALLLPVAAALVLGVLAPFLLLADLVSPGLTGRVVAPLWDPGTLGVPYLAAVALPVVILMTVGLVTAALLWARDRRRFPEAFEAVLDAQPARDRLAGCLGQVVRGVGVSNADTDAELGRRFVSLALENLGQPGFRELVLRTTDLDTGGPLAFALLDPERRGGRADRATLDLRDTQNAPLAFDALMTGLLPPLLARARRIALPRGGLFAGETHRLCDATVAGGCGLSDAIAAGAEQVILVTACPEEVVPTTVRRGPRGLASGLLGTLERQAVERELRDAERLNRMVETVGIKADDGSRSWQDPATGRNYRVCALYVVRPDRRGVGPLDFDGAIDPVSEVREQPADLVDQGYRDAYRLFVEPVVGAAPAEPAPPVAERVASGAPGTIEL